MTDDTTIQLVCKCGQPIKRGTMLDHWRKEHPNGKWLDQTKSRSEEDRTNGRNTRKRP